MADDIVQTITLEGQDEVVKGFETIGEAGAQNLKKASQAADQAGDSLDKLGEKAGETGEKVKQAADKANQAIGQIGQGAGGRDIGKEVFEAFSQGAEKAGEEIKHFGGELAESLGKIGGSFGQAGKEAGEFVEKIVSEFAKVGPALANIKNAFNNVGGGFEGLIGSARALGEALGPIGIAAGTIASAFTGLATAMAPVAGHLEDLKQSTEGTEEDFEKLENAALQSGVGIDGMVEASNRLRDSLRSSSVQLQNYIEMFSVMRDRAKEAGEMAEVSAQKAAIAAERREAKRSELTGGPGLSSERDRELKLKELDIEDEMERVREERAKTTEERFKARYERMARSMKEAFGGAGRLFTIGIDPKDIEGLEQAEQAIEKLKNASKGEQLAGFLEQYKAIIQTFGEGSKEAEEARRAMNELVPPDVARKLEHLSQQIIDGMKSSKQATEELADSLNGVTEQERKALTGLGKDMAQSGEIIERSLVKLGAAIANLGIGPVFKAAAQVIASMIDSVRELVQAFQPLVDIIKVMIDIIDMIAIGWEKALAATKAFFATLRGDTKEAAEQLKKLNELQERKQELDERTKRHAQQAGKDIIEDWWGGPGSDKYKKKRGERPEEEEEEHPTHAREEDAKRRTGRSPVDDYELQRKAYDKYADPVQREKYIQQQGGTPQKVIDETGKVLFDPAQKAGSALDKTAGSANKAAESLDKMKAPEHRPEHREEEHKQPEIHTEKIDEAASRTAEALEKVAQPTNDAVAALAKMAQPTGEIAENVAKLATPATQAAENLNKVPQPARDTASTLDKVPQPASDTATSLSKIPDPTNSAAGAMSSVADAAKSAAAALSQVRAPQSKAAGGVIEGYAEGGTVGGDDRVPIRVSKGEYIVNKDGSNLGAAVAHFKGYQDGGQVMGKPWTHDAGRDVTPPTFDESRGRYITPAEDQSDRDSRNRERKERDFQRDKEADKEAKDKQREQDQQDRDAERLRQCRQQEAVRNAQEAQREAAEDAKDKERREADEKKQKLKEAEVLREAALKCNAANDKNADDKKKQEEDYKRKVFAWRFNHGLIDPLTGEVSTDAFSHEAVTMMHADGIYKPDDKERIKKMQQDCDKAKEDAVHKIAVERAQKQIDEESRERQKQIDRASKAEEKRLAGDPCAKGYAEGGEVTDNKKGSNLFGLPSVTGPDFDINKATAEKRSELYGQAKAGYLGTPAQVATGTPEEAEHRVRNPLTPSEAGKMLMDKFKGVASKWEQPNMAGGGAVGGYGSGTSDSNLIWASKGEYVVRADGSNLGAAVRHFQRMAQGGIVGAFSANVRGYAQGGQVAASPSTGGGVQSYHALDITTDKGSFRAHVTPDTMSAIQASALSSKLSATGERPSWYS